MLDAIKLEDNKQRFITLLRTISREHARIEDLIARLETSDFFTAPGSTRYHAVYSGGLCQHSLNVYDNLKELVTLKGLDNIISTDSILICGLLHDFSKMNLYKPTVKNEKVYFEGGTKHDSCGNFDWVAKPGWKVASDDERFIFGNHEETSEFMIRTYIPLSYEESAAILNHHGGVGWDSVQGGLASKVMAKYPLAALLHIADMISTFIDEKNE